MSNFASEPFRWLRLIRRIIVLENRNFVWRVQNFAAPTFGLESPAARRSLVLLCLLLQFFQCPLLPRTTALTARRFFPKADAKLHPFPITTKSSPFFSLVLTGFNIAKADTHGIMRQNSAPAKQYHSVSWGCPIRLNITPPSIVLIWALQAPTVTKNPSHDAWSTTAFNGIYSTASASLCMQTTWCGLTISITFLMVLLDACPDVWISTTLENASRKSLNAGFRLTWDGSL